MCVLLYFGGYEYTPIQNLHGSRAGIDNILFLFGSMRSSLCVVETQCPSVGSNLPHLDIIHIPGSTFISFIAQLPYPNTPSIST